MSDNQGSLTEVVYARGNHPLEAIIITPEISRRPVRPANYVDENKSLRKLSNLLSHSPELALQNLAEEAKLLTGADAAGISIEEVAGDKEIFRWHATCGTMAPFIQGTMPRHFSPCGVVCAENSPVLMRNMIRHFQYVEMLQVPLYEVLYVPFMQDGKPIGTVWLVSHGSHKEFDSEDLRVLKSLAEFTSGIVHSYFQIAGMKSLVKKLENEKEVRDLFVAALTHDLRTPLAAAHLTAQLLEKTVPNEPKVSNTVQRIMKNIRKADAMISDLLDANRLKAGQPILLRKAQIDLTTVVHESVSDLRILHPQKIETDLTVEPIPGNFDATSIRRVIENLTVNAIKYGDYNRSVTIRFGKRDDSAVISVHNFGTPIESDDQEQLFLHFRRSKSALNSGVRGWGIGLTIVQGIVEAHGGKVTVRSLAEEGTTFTVTIPLK